MTDVYVIRMIVSCTFHLKGKFRLAWDSVASWKLSEPVRMRVPLPEAVLLALSCLWAPELAPITLFCL